MTVWNVTQPIAWINGEQYVLPTPSKRPDDWEQVKETWPNLNYTMQVQHYGFRYTADWEWKHLKQNEVQQLDNLINAVDGILLAPWGLNAPRFQVYVADARDLYVDDMIRVDGKQILFKSVKLYPEKITKDHFIKVTPMGQKIII